MRKLVCPTKARRMTMQPDCESTEFTAYLAKNDVTMLQCTKCGTHYDLESLKKRVGLSK